MEPSWRKPAGVLLLLAGLAVYAVAVASLSATVGAWPQLAQLLFYAVAGVAWLLPLRPLLIWMETGRFR